MGDLDQAIARVCRKDFYYWLFRHLSAAERKEPREVEVRIDLPVESIGDVAAVPGWRIAHVKPDDGMLFLRRIQRLTDKEVRAMFVEVLTFAHNHSGRFHSWTHKPELSDW